MQPHHNLSSSSSSSSSSKLSSTSSPFSTPVACTATTTVKHNPEDVWEDMTTQHSKLTTSCNMVLQDSLGAPLTPPPSSLPSLPVGPSQSPSPVLNLNSTLEFGLFDAGAHPDHLRGFPVRDLNHPYEDDFMGSQFLCSFGRKRLSAERDAGRADGRQKRLVKKRKSAARSRARKQVISMERLFPIALS